MTPPRPAWRALLPLAALRLGLMLGALVAIRVLVDCSGGAQGAAAGEGWCGLLQVLLFGVAILAVARLTRGPWRRALNGG